MKIQLPPETAIDAEVDLCTSDGAYYLRARLNISLPGLDSETARRLIDAAHRICPCSKAVRNNIDVEINII
jgi:organic hydroperoxide reductase OsmC/OhrA